MPARVLVSISPSGAVSVFVDDPDVQVLVLTEEEGGTEYAAAPAQVDQVVRGLPHFNEARVAAGFEAGREALLLSTAEVALGQAARNQANRALTAWFAASGNK